MNNLTIVGNVGKDPEIKTVGTRKVAEFSVAFDPGKDKDGNKRESIWFSVNQWGDNQTEFIQKYVKKGQKIAVAGKLDVQTWTSENTGEKKFKLIIHANQINPFLSKADDAAKQPAAAGATSGAGDGGSW